MKLILFQASILTLVVFATPSLGDATQLKAWLDNSNVKRADIEWDETAKDETRYKTIPSSSYPGSIEEVEQPNNVIAAKLKDEKYNMVVIFDTKPSSGNPIEDPESPANFLPFFTDKARFLLVDGRRGFFTTSMLSGCDMWIADKVNLEPLIIHINANKYKDDPLRNLQYKQDLAVEALEYFNRNIIKNRNNYYTFYLRVSFDYAYYISDPDKKKEIQNYWTKFHNDFREATAYLYKDDANPSMFYGARTGGSKVTWNFSLKSFDSGKVKKISCPDGNSCTIL